jgi:Lon protease-like protein
MQTDHTFGVVLIREGQEVGGPAIPYDVGTTALIQDVERLPDGRMNIVTIGHERFRVRNYDVSEKPYLMGHVSPWPWHDDLATEPALRKAVQWRLDQYVDLFAKASETEIQLDLTPQHPTTLAVLAAVVLQIPLEEKQELLEIPSVNELLRQLDQRLLQENRALKIMLASYPSADETGHPFSKN